MKCPKCQFDNRDGAKFCSECGLKFELSCSECGSVIRSGSKFCDECGAKVAEPLETPFLDYTQPQSYTPKFLADKILTSRSSIEGERKLVTVLFADVAHYTSMAEKLDPEDVHQIMDGCFQILIDQIHKFEGTINQFTGDGVMALFGAPVAHEDHAQRGCYAALAIQEAIDQYGANLKETRGVDFLMRVGLNSGPVIVGAIGDDLRMDYTAVGDTTNLAARMESIAKPGTVLGTSNIHRLTKDFFQFESIGEVQIKGKEETVEAYRLLKAAEIETRIEAATAKGLTKFVGRKEETLTLKKAFEKAQSGAGQVVGVVGEAGVGKSRLLIELKNILPKEKFIYFEGRCLHYGSSMAYLPILDILKSYFEIKEEDDERVIKKKMETKILQLDESLKYSLSSFQELLSLSVDDRAYLQLEPSAKKIRAFESIRDLFVRESQDNPLILVFEDLHWIDSTSQEFLSYLVDWLASTRILLILLYRPEYTHPWGNKSFYTKVGVNQLTNQSSAELVQNLLEGGDVIPELKELIFNRTGGNPFFVEELTQSLLENGFIDKEDHQYILTRKASEIEIPDTIQGIIAARIDRIEENLKRIMQVASVIGREFAYRILETTMGMREGLKSSLINLQGLEFIYEKQLFPELEYIFKHALTQEVAYNSLLQNKKNEIHKKIGNAIETLYPERLDEYYDLLAYHYLRSNNHRKAIEYLDLANQKAVKLNAMEEAKSYFEEAMKILDLQPDTEANQHRRISILVNQWLVFTLLFQIPEYYDLLIRYEHVVIELGDQRLLGIFLLGKGQCQYWLGEYDQALETLSKAADLCEASKANEYGGLAYNYMQWTCVCKGDYEQVLNFKEEALRTIEQRFNLRVYVWALTTVAFAYTYLGHWDKAIANAKEALKAAEEYSDSSLISFAAWNISHALLFKGDLNRAEKYAELAVQKAPTFGDKAWAQGFLACIWCRAGELQRGLELLTKVVSIQKEGRFMMAKVGFSNQLGYAYFQLGQRQKAIQILQYSLELAERSGLMHYIALNHFFLGQVHLETNSTQAAAHFEQSIDSLRKTKSDPSFIEFLRSILMLTKGNLRQGIKIAEDLSEVFLKNGSVINYVEAEYMLGNIYLQIVIGEGPKTLSFLAKNIAFLIRSFPNASEKAEYHLNNAIRTAKEIGAKLRLGQAYQDLGLLHKAKKRSDQAKECISEAIQIFEQCKAEEYLKRANEAFGSLQ